MNNYESLIVKTRPELKAIAQGLGLTIAHKEKETSIIERILLVTQQIPVERTEKEPEPEKALEPAPEPKHDELTQRLQPYMERGLRVTLTEDSFLFEYGTRQDSGTLKQPVDVIIRCANGLIRIN